MPKEPELKARDKVVMRMTRDGAIEATYFAMKKERGEAR